MTFLQCGCVAALGNAFKIKSKLLQALFGKQGTLASYPNCEVLQIFPKEKLRVPLQAPAPSTPLSGRPVRKGLGSHYIQRFWPGRQAKGWSSLPACQSLSHRKPIIGPLTGEVLSPQLVSQGLHKVLSATFFPDIQLLHLSFCSISTYTTHPKRAAFICLPVPTN